MWIEIRVVPDLAAQKAELKRCIDQIDKGLGVKGRRVMIFTPETYAHVFTPERLKLLLLLQKEEHTSISSLATRVGRHFEAVHRDLKVLASDDLIRLEKHGREVQPIMNKIRMPVLA